MKKVILITVSIIVVLLLTAVALPFVFKGTLMNKAKTAINENVNATVDFSAFKLSLFKSFPKIEAEIQGLSIIGKNEFANDTLVYLGSIATDLSFSDLFSSDGITINSIRVNDANINLLSLQNGSVNWDIMLTDNTAEEPESESSSDMEISLQEININNLDFNYKDEISTTNIQLLSSNFDASGDIDGTVTSFNIDGEIGEFIFEYDSTRYISNTVLKAKSELSVDYDKMIFTFGESTLYLNELPLALSGSFEMPSDSMYFDLQFTQPQSDFATLLAMVPADYQTYLEDVQTTGAAGLEGNVTGWFYEEDYPGMDIHMYINDATFQYVGSPEKVEKIALDGRISKPQGDLDLLEINVSEAHAQIRKNPLDMSLTLTHPMTDPIFDAAFSGKIDFNRLADVIPMDSIDLQGIVDGQMSIKGKMSAVDAQDYSQIASSGNFNFSNFKIKTPQITRPVEVPSGAITINNSEINLNSFSAKTGSSDFRLNGKLSDYLPYFFLDKTLKGNFNLQSNYLNLDELATLVVTEDSVEINTTDSLTAFQVPGNIDMVFRSDVNRATFNQMNITNIVGIVEIKDRIMNMQQLSMNMLDGEMIINGAYISNDENNPEFDFNLDIKSFDIPTAYQSITTMRRYMPIAARSQGNISSQINFKGQFDEHLKLIASSLNGSGLLNTQNLQVIDSPTFSQFQNFLKEDKLKNVKVNDFTAHFSIEDGSIDMKPFDTKIADQEVSVSGQLSIDQQLDMAMDFKLNKNDISNDITNTLGIIPGFNNIELINASVIISGDIKSPEVSLDLSEARKQIQDEVKNATQDEIKNSINKLGNELQKLFGN